MIEGFYITVRPSTTEEIYSLYIQMSPSLGLPSRNPVAFGGNWQLLERAINPRHSEYLPDGWETCFVGKPKVLSTAETFKTLGACFRIPVIMYCDLYLASNPHREPTHQEVANALKNRYQYAYRAVKTMGIGPHSISMALRQFKRVMGLTDLSNPEIKNAA
jgi:hypothetical protein